MIDQFAPRSPARNSTVDADAAAYEDARKGERMFQLGGSNYPATREELVSAVTEGLRGLLTLPAGRQVVKIDPSAGPGAAGGYPAFDRVVIDLTGSRFAGDKIPPEPKGTGKTQPAGVAGKLEIAGHPLYLRESAVDLALTASAATFNFDRDAAGRPILVLADARDGHATVEIRKQDLDALVMAAVREGAKAQGVQILEAQLALAQIDDRSVAADVRVKAKKLFMTATVNLRGKLGIDENFTARLSDLAISGEGVLGEMASAGIRPHILELNGREFPLSALPLGDVRVRDLRVQTGDVLRVTAAFGS
jgi:hypothetical protein